MAIKQNTDLIAAIHEAAEALDRALLQRAPCKPIRTLFSDVDLNVAYEIQQVNRQKNLQRGDRLIGRKIGLTNPVVQKQLGVTQPDYGVLYASQVYGDAEEIPFENFLQPRIEGEIAFVLGRDLDMASPSIVDVLNAVEYMLPAFEVVDSRIENWDIQIMDTIADNASAGAIICGTTKKRIEDFDFYTCGMVIESGNEQLSSGAGAGCMGNPLNALTWLARKMSEMHLPLRAGEIILSGALGPMIPVQKERAYELRIAGLGIVHSLFT